MNFLTAWLLIPLVTGTQAATLLIEAQLSVQAEFENVEPSEAQAQGWTIVVNEWDETEFHLRKTITENELPKTFSVGPAALVLRKDGRIELGIEVGDADSSSEATLHWPQASNGWLPLSTPLKLSASGGDHASGAWGFSGEATVTVQP